MSFVRALGLAVTLLAVGCNSGSGSNGPIVTGDPDDGNRTLGETCDPTLAAMACAGSTLGCCPPPGCHNDAGCVVNPLCQTLDAGGCSP